MAQVRRHGFRATVGKAFQVAGTRIYFDETQVWFEIPLGEDRPRVAMPEGIQLVHGGVDELSLLAQLPGVGEAQAELRLKAGHDLWMAVEGRKAAFACWIFRGSVPTIAAPKEQLIMPPGIVCLEESVASPDFRGRGIAPAVWSVVADGLQREGVAAMVTRCKEDNVAVRRALAKSGFREIAIVHFRRAGLRQYTTIRPEPGSTADWLAGRLMDRESLKKRRQ